MLLWELVDHALKDPHFPMTIASHHRAGELGLFDYLFTTAATPREGPQSTQDFVAFAHRAPLSPRACGDIEHPRRPDPTEMAAQSDVEDAAEAARIARTIAAGSDGIRARSRFWGLRALLREEGVTFQRLKTWKASKDPQYQDKKARIEQLYAIADREAAPGDGYPEVVFCVESSGR
jgi:hypothetical protein